MSMQQGFRFHRLSCLPVMVTSLTALGIGTSSCAVQNDADQNGIGTIGGQPAIASNGGDTAAGGAATNLPRSNGGMASSSTPSGGAASSSTPTGGTNSGATSSGGSTSSTPTTDKFSFFMASQAGLVRLSGSQNGFGGDLRFGQANGLSGADEICRQLAESSLAGNGKTWRAFLSVTRGPNGTAVHAIDRIGEGPWYDRLGRVFALTKADLLNTRPRGADASIVNDFPNETGELNHSPGGVTVDNHNTLTGSGTNGTLDNQGLRATCQDWTSATSSGGKPRCGVSWPRDSLTHWISILNEGGCAPGATPGGGADSGPQGTVGALGGYGGIYCFALTP